MPNTREKLIELLKNVDVEMPITTAEYLIAGGVTVQKWIPVTEMLPEVGADVLCWYEYFRFGSYNRMYQTYGIGYYFRDGMWGGDVSNGQNCKVLAWMPLPKPPKTEED